MSTIRHRVSHYRELILAVVFLALASWELLEMALLRARGGRLYSRPSASTPRRWC